MDNSTFVGFFLTKLGVPPSSFPVPNDNKMWKVYKSPAEIYIAQAIDTQRQPIGEAFPLDESQLAELLVPESDPNKELDSNAYDLISVLYKRSTETVREESHPLTLIVEEDCKEVLSKKNSFLGKKETLHADVPISALEKLRVALDKVKIETPNPHLESLQKLLSNDAGTFINPDDPVFFTDLGVIFRRSKHYELAYLLHSYALTLSPGDEHILFNLARTEFEMGNIEDACAHLKQSLKKNANFTIAKDFLAFIEGRLSS